MITATYNSDYIWNSLEARLRKFHETPAPILPGFISPAQASVVAFQLKVKDLDNESIFYLAYVEEAKENWIAFDRFDQQFLARGLNYRAYSDFLKARGILSRYELEIQAKATKPKKSASRRKAAA